MKKFAKIFKTFSLLALVMLTVATPVFGGSVTPDLLRVQEKQSAIYNHIADDFMLLTRVEKQQADAYLAEISGDENVARLSDEVLQILPVLSAKAEYGKNAIYIQDNYDQIVANLSPADKAKIDKYYLTGVLQYYDEYATSEDIENLNQDRNK